MIYRNIFITILGLLLTTQLSADIYVILYATYEGKTGHVGLAIDEYKIIVKDINKRKGLYQYDTIKTGFLKYYDMWPKDERFKLTMASDQLAKYYSLPSYSTNNLITIKTLKEEGIPHKEHYPVDGILSKSTNLIEDLLLTAHINSVINKNKAFNAVKYNCTDFVLECLLNVTRNLVVERERVFSFKVHTPNNLFKSLMKQAGFYILKNPGNKIMASFFNDRIIYNVIKVIENENNKVN